MTQRPMLARWFGGLGFRPNGRAGGYVALLALLRGWGPSTVVRWGWLSWTCTPGDSRPGGPPWVRGAALNGRTPLPLEKRASSVRGWRCPVPRPPCLQKKIETKFIPIVLKIFVLGVAPLGSRRRWTTQLSTTSCSRTSGWASGGAALVGGITPSARWSPRALMDSLSFSRRCFRGFGSSVLPFFPPVDLFSPIPPPRTD